MTMRTKVIVLTSTRELYSLPPGSCTHFLQGIVVTSGCFLCFIPAVPLLVLIATDEDYCRVVETFGFHILS